MRTLVEQTGRPPDRAGRRGEGARAGRLGPRPARPRGAGHPRLGRGPRATRPPRVRAAEYVARDRGAARLRAVPGPWSGPGNSGRVPRHDRARGPPLLDRPRVGAGRRGPGPGRHHRLRAGRPRRRGLRRASPRWAQTSTPATLLGEVESTKSVSEIYAPVSGPGGRGERRAHRRAGAGQRGPLRRGLDLRHRAVRPGARSRPCWTRTPTASSSRRERVPLAALVAAGGPSDRDRRSDYPTEGVLPQLRAPESLRSELLLVLWNRPPNDVSETTVTLQPVDEHGESPDEEPTVTLVEVPAGSGRPRRQARPQRRRPLPAGQAP